MISSNLLSLLSLLLLRRNLGILIVLALATCVILLGKLSIDRIQERYEPRLNASAQTLEQLFSAGALYVRLLQDPERPAERDQLIDLLDEISSSNVLEADIRQRIGLWSSSLAADPPADRDQIAAQAGRLHLLGQRLEFRLGDYRQQLYRDMQRLAWTLVTLGLVFAIVVMAIFYPLIEHNMKRLQHTAASLRSIMPHRQLLHSDLPVDDLERLAALLQRSHKRRNKQQAQLRRALGLTRSMPFGRVLDTFSAHRIARRGIDILPEALCILNSTGRILYANDAFRQDFEIRPVSLEQTQHLPDGHTPEEEQLRSIVAETLRRGQLQTHIEILTVPRLLRAQRYSAWDFRTESYQEYALVLIEKRQSPSDSFFDSDEGGWGTL